MKRRILLYGSLFALMVVLPTVSSLLYGKRLIEIFQMGVMSFIFFFVWVIMELNGKKENISGLNIPIPYPVFVIAYAGVSILAVTLPLMSALVWPVAFVALVLIYFTDYTHSLLFLGQFLCVASLLKGCDVNLYMCHLLTGLVVIALFSQVDESYKVWGYFIISVLTGFVSLSVNELLFYSTEFKWEDYLLPLLSFFLNVVLMLILLKVYSLFSFQRLKDWYLTVNDTEYAILSKAKEENPKSYYLAIHTSYLSDKMCKAFDLDKDVVKTASYYWRLMENARDKTDYTFPEEAMNLLKELMSHKKPTSREAVAVFVSDEIIRDLMRLFEKDSQIKMNYKTYFDTYFEEKFMSGFFNSCDYSLKELYAMKKILTDEGLYYDFLR